MRIKSASGVAKSSWFLIASITLLNAMGMTIVYPILPFITQQYVSDPSVVALWVGALGSVFALCTFVSAPFLGALSDRVGRKPVLVVSLFGSVVGYVLFGIGGSILILVVARVIAGLTAGDTAVIFAYIADVTPPEERAARFGLLGALTGIGFMVGPAIGGLLTNFGLSTPFFVTAGITTVTVLLTLLVLPETLTPELRSKSLSLEGLHPFRSIGDAFKRTELRPLLLIFIIMCIPNTFFENNLSVLAMDAAKWGPTQIGLLVSAVGISDIIVKGALLRVLLPRLGERGVVLVGMVGQSVGCAALALVGSFLPFPWLFATGVLLFAASEGGMQAALQGLLANAVAPDEQGWLAGSRSSLSSATQMVVPLLGGWLYTQVGHSAPYWIGVGMILIAIFAPARSLFRTGDTPEPEEANV
ncbi:MAG: MFS transporter [Methanothrix sp.]|jgi:DHA1 family tetracycline resistance protein-like MFS transporter|nr:MFS transporter [Methanothrix sp.]